MKKKQMKKELLQKKVPKEKPTTEKDEVYKLLRIMLILLGVFVLFYFITKIISNNKTEDPDDNDNVANEILYDEIPAGTIFTRKEKEYYVFVKDLDKMINSLYENIIADYEGLDSALPVYTVDLNNVFNKEYLSEESNKNAKNVSELKLKGATLIKIKSGKITLYLEGMTEISGHFSELVNSEKEDN